MAGRARRPRYERLASSALDNGAFSDGGSRLSYHALTGVPAGLGWVIVASGPQPSLLAAAGLSLGVAVLLAFSLALAIAGLISLQQRRRRDARALSAAEGRRAEAERRSRTDALTGLYNRRHMVDAIAAELARSERTGVPPSVLMLDIDNVRRINEGYGHDVGDHVLSEIARRLRGRLRGYDVLGRWDDEAFVALMPGVPDDDTLRSLADQIRRLVGALPVAVDDRTLLPVTVSVGAAARRQRAAIGRGPRRLRAPRAGGCQAPRPRPRAAVQRPHGRGSRRRGARDDPAGARARAGVEPAADLPGVDAERVSELSASISERCAWASPSLRAAESAGLLHDVGTVVVPERILALVGPPSPARPTRLREARGRRRADGAQRRRCQRSRGDRRRP